MKINNIVEGIKIFFEEEEGLTIVEYAIGGALVAAGAVLAFNNLGTSVCETIDQLDEAVQGNVVEQGTCPE